MDRGAARSATARTWLRDHRRLILSIMAIVVLVVLAQEVIPGLDRIDLDVSLRALAAGVGHLGGRAIPHLLAHYGYAAVLLFVAIESIGIPFPGETMLLAASVYAGTTQHLHIALVIAAAATGAILGDNIGYLIGREGGARLLQRYGRYIRLDERRLKLGQYLFLRHGGKVVFFGRFVSVLRTWAAFLAGAYALPWRRFLAYNAAGGIVWSLTYGLGGWLLGDNIHWLTGPLGIVGAVLGLGALGSGALFVRRNEHRLADAAERALPGPFASASRQANGAR